MKHDYSIAVKGIIVREDQVLVLHRSPAEMKASFLNKREKWDLPGGGLHYNERCEEGLRREITEETSLQIEILRPFSTYDVLKSFVHLCIITYLCRYEAGDVVLSKEHDKYHWMNRQQILESTLPRWMRYQLLEALDAVQTEKRNKERQV